MRPITLNPVLIPTSPATRSPAAGEILRAVARTAGAGLRHVLYLPQVIVAAPVFLALYWSRGGR